jgi:acetyltransferase-like isoleucine patch superfamily enzyme
MVILEYLIRGIRYLGGRVDEFFSTLLFRLLCNAYRVNYGKNLICRGLPFLVMRRHKSIIQIGDNVIFNSRLYANSIGRNQRCIISVRGKLEIGNNTGVSSAAIVVHEHVKIGNHVRIGGNVVIYDTDFHSLNSSERTAKIENRVNIKTSPVIIEDYAFIGAHSTILKGVKIGRNSIIGAGSLVCKSVPPNEIWAGNPAKFLRKVK